MSNSEPQLATVEERVHQQMDEFTDAERRVARALLADYPAAALGSTQHLASTAKVSGPTVIRFATRLGFDGFADMRTHLHAEISARTSSPVLRTIAHGAPAHRSSGFHDAMERRAAIVDKSLRFVPEPEFLAACSLIAGCPRKVLIAGGFFSSYIARILALQLSQVRRDVQFVEEPLRRDTGALLDAKPQSVLILFDLRRYESQAMELARSVRASGLRLVLITDRWMSPVAELAQVVLPVEVEETPFDSFVGLLALVETMVEFVVAADSARSIRRMKRWEQGAITHTRGASTD